MAKATINIILADDHEIFRDGFAALIEKVPQINLAGFASDGEELVRATERFNPDVVLTDILMPRKNGIEATREIVRRFPGTGIIGFSMFNEPYLLKDMLNAGAIGFLVKNSRKDEVVAAISSVSRGLPYFCADTAMRLSGIQQRRGRKEAKVIFTDKEKEILLMICRGMTNKDIAATMYQSVRTIEGYRERIMEKAGAANPASLVVFAISRDLVFIDIEGKVRLVADSCRVSPRECMKGGLSCGEHLV